MSAQNLMHALRDKSPAILTAMAIGGVFVTSIFAVRATPKALDILEDYERQKFANDKEPTRTTAVDIVKLTWKEYLPTVLMGSATIACILGANSIHVRRGAAMAGVYAITETALREYQAKVVETLGEKKDREIRQEIAEDHMKANPVSSAQIFITGQGDVLCYDKLSGRYFRSAIEKLRRAENDLNHTLLSEMWISLNEFYETIGLPDIELGEELGWSVDGLISMEYSSKLTENDEPCLVIDHYERPIPYNRR